MKKNSWHYYFAKLANGDNRIYSGQMSICEYIRKVIVGIGLAGFIAALVIGALALVGGVLWETFGAIFGFAEFGDLAKIFYGVFGGLFVLFGGVYLFTRFQDYWEDKTEMLLASENKSLTSSVYKSYKEKICFRVDFNDE